MRRYDLIRRRIFDHPILVNPGFVRECVSPHDGLVRLHKDSSDFGQQLARRKQLLGHDRGLIRIVFRPHPHYHDQLFQRCIAGPLADAIHRALHLARASAYGCQ